MNGRPVTEWKSVAQHRVNADNEYPTALTITYDSDDVVKISLASGRKAGIYRTLVDLTDCTYLSITAGNVVDDGAIRFVVVPTTSSYWGCIGEYNNSTGAAAYVDIDSLPTSGFGTMTLDTSSLSGSYYVGIGIYSYDTKTTSIELQEVRKV